MNDSHNEWISFRGPATPTCVSAGSSRSFPNPLTRALTANAAALEVVGPRAFDAEDYKGRNVVERNFNDV